MASNLDQDVQEAVKRSSQSGQGFTPQPNQKKQKPQPTAIAKPTNQTTATLEKQALKSYERLGKVDESVKTALVKEAVRNGQNDALTEAVAETTGYLGMKAELKIASAKKRIGGSRAVSNKSDAAAAAAVTEILEAVEVEDEDFLSELSQLEGSNPAQLLPSLY